MLKIGHTPDLTITPMHESVLLSGAETDIGKRVQLVDLDAYSELLKPVIQVTKIELLGSYGDANQIGKEIWSRIRKLKSLTRTTSNAFVRTSISGFRAAYSDWRASHKSRRLNTISPVSPLASASVGWELVRQSARKNGYIEDLFWGLGILGWVSAIYSDMRVCKYCFRWSVPRSPFCYIHSQSKFIHGDVGKAYSRNRAGARTLNITKQLNFEVRQTSFLMQNLYRRTVLAEYLFFNTISDEEGSELRHALSDAPQVLASLGGKKVLSLPHDKLFGLVRNHINPMEFFPIALIYNVQFAEKLMLIEKQRKSGRPIGKRNKQSHDMLEKAIEMFKCGSRPIDVAKALGVSRAAVSNWISRCDEVRCAYSQERPVRALDNTTKIGF